MLTDVSSLKSLKSLGHKLSQTHHYGPTAMSLTAKRHVAYSPAFCATRQPYKRSAGSKNCERPEHDEARTTLRWCACCLSHFIVMHTRSSRNEQTPLRPFVCPGPELGGVLAFSAALRLQVLKGRSLRRPSSESKHWAVW